MTNALSTYIDALNTGIAAVVRWFILAMVVIQFCIVIARYTFGYSAIWIQESVLYLHASTFMLAAAYTLLCDKHVRVDIFYARLAPRWQRRVEVCGHVFFLLPAMSTLLYWSWPSVRNAWRVKEGALTVGGLPYVYLLKSLITAFCVLLILQSLSLLFRALKRSRGN